MSGAEGVYRLLERVKIKIDNSEFVYYVVNATLYL